MFPLDHDSNIPLVAQIVAGVTRLIEERSLRPGAKMPSIRQFAHTHEVSLFTVSEAYDRLVATGLLASRPNAGFYVRRRSSDRHEEDPAGAHLLSFDTTWYLHSIFESHGLAMRPGCGWLPGDWLFHDGLQRALRRLSSRAMDSPGYGDPKGFRPLRQMIGETLADREVAASVDQVLLTQGASQALDMVARRLVRPGDAVLVDEPGYANLMYILRFNGARLLGVPRTPNGYDLAPLERLLAEQQPRVMFTQPRMHSPTGSIAQFGHLHKLLQLAERHDMLIVENDIYADLDPERRPSLASLDQLSRVVHIGSFSKTVSPNLRVGYLAAPADLVDDLARLKMVAGLTSSEFAERIAYEAVTDARWRRHLKLVHKRLGAEQERVAGRLAALGFELFSDSRLGMFLWARHPACSDSKELAALAAQHDVLLGPGHLFSTSGDASPWMRFNVAFCGDERIFEFLRLQLASPPPLSELPGQRGF